MQLNQLFTDTSWYRWIPVGVSTSLYTLRSSLYFQKVLWTFTAAAQPCNCQQKKFKVTLKQASHWPIIKNKRVLSRWFDRMKFALIIFLRSFRFALHDHRTKSQSGNRKITSDRRTKVWHGRLQPILDYLRLLFSPDASSPNASFFHLIFHLTSDQLVNGTPT